jgi:disulfide bond formation protein DsbB
MTRLTPRVLYLAGFAACAGLLGFALYLQYYQAQDPCPLCVFQRIAFIVMMVLFLVAGLHAPRRTGAIVYSSALFITAAVGAAIAARHVWLQHLPKDRVPSCGPGLDYMLKKFPFTQVLDKVLKGSGECAEAGWRMLGLSIAEWSLFWLVVLGGYAIYAAVVSAKRARRA